MAEGALLESVVTHVVHHRRFYAGFFLGVLVFVSMRAARVPHPLIGAGDSFFAAYLLFVSFAFGKTAKELRERAAVEDEGMPVVFVVMLAAIIICLGSVFAILHHSHGQITAPLVLALVGAPLGWFTLHVVAAFHYAYLFYRPQVDDDPHNDALRPLQFPGSADPDAWDFLYYAFVVGMTAQVSDVQVTDTKLRRATLGHGIVSFFFNTVLIAMAVNAVVNIAT